MGYRGSSSGEDGGSEERSLAMLNSGDITTKPFDPPVKK